MDHWVSNMDHFTDCWVKIGICGLHYHPSDPFLFLFQRSLFLVWKFYFLTILYVIIAARISFVFAAIHDVLPIATSAKILWTSTLCVAEDPKCYLYAELTSQCVRKLCTDYALIATKRSDWLHLILVIWPKYVMLDTPDPYFSKGTAAPDYKWIILNRIVKSFSIGSL